MAFNAQLPASIHFSRFDQVSDGSGDTSCYSFMERISGITNPVSLRYDILYPNAIAAQDELNESHRHRSSGMAKAEGCRGHQIDNDFPFDTPIPFPIPLVMYPTKRKGTMLHEMDLCAEPVLNWEGYMQDLRNSIAQVIMSKDEEDPVNADSDSKGVSKRAESETVDTEDIHSSHKPKTTHWFHHKTIQSILLADNDVQHKRSLRAEEYPEERRKRMASKSKKTSNKTGVIKKKFIPKRNTWNHLEMPADPTFLDASKSKMPGRVFKKLKNTPAFKIEGSWNHLFGGHNGACCYVSQRGAPTQFLFTGKGSQLRCVHLGKSGYPFKSSLFSYSLDSIWEEPIRSIPFNSFAKDKSPFNDLVFQIVSNEANDLLSVRRGKSIQIYSIAEEHPYILETIPNLYYGTSKACPSNSQEKEIIKDPLLTGVTFNPKYSPELVTVDENGVIRICDIHDESTVSLYRMEKDFNKEISLARAPDGYPTMRLNEASGVTYSSLAHLFVGWKDSLVSLCDRRSPSPCLSTLMDLRKDPYLRALSEQSAFSCQTGQKYRNIKLNEYISCVRASTNDDTYYYVGTSSKLYMMDMRVPNRPVFRVTHGLQSALTYIDVYSDENFDVIVGGSQRLAETICIPTDRTHTLCTARPGCTGGSPVLFSYPRHLSNPRTFFDTAIKNGHDFSFPSDQEMVKSHCYAWPTGLAVLPSLAMANDFKRPKGFVIATSNNYGDIFLQEWKQKPVYYKMDMSNQIVSTFMKSWKTFMSPKLSSCPVPKPSVNPYKPVDLSLLIEPAAKEIEKLAKVRSTPFNCFKPNTLQFEDNQRTMIPMKDLLNKLGWYKNEKVKVMVNVWSGSGASVTTTNQTEPVQEIKVEPDEIEESTSSLHTINIDVSEEEIESEEDTDRAENSANEMFQPFYPPVLVPENEETVSANGEFLVSHPQIKDENHSQQLIDGREFDKVESSEEASFCQLSPEDFIFQDSQDLFSEHPTYNTPDELSEFPSSTQLSQSQRSQSQLKKKSRKSGFV